MGKDEPIPHPEENVKPLNYREQFQVKLFECVSELEPDAINCRAAMLPHNSSSAYLFGRFRPAQLTHFLLSSPCEAAAKASMDCMNRNDYDRDFCLDYFQAYRDCKKAWMNQRKEDRRAGRPTS
ncbi:hypothetical protein H0H92_013569 [Tricholoma furcatifolium]|nr:hypothetical protein H0H92_013569 [Tricholoma furcatifolium]